MSYDDPTAAEFKQRFPEFSDQDDADIEVLFNYAKLWVDPDTWVEQDYKPAIIALAAHYLRMSLLAIAQSNASAGVGGGDGGGVSDTPLQTFLSSVSIGDRTVSWRAAPRSSLSVSSGGSADVTSADEFLRRSIYGQLFLQLRRRNIFPIVVI